MAVDLVCLGNLTIDDVVLPDGTTRMACFGGDAIYAALGASYWTREVQFVAPVGTDFPTQHLITLRDTGLDLRGLPQRQVPSIRNWVVYESDGRRTWILRSNPNDFYELSPTLDDIPDDYRTSKAFLILAMDLAAQEQLVPPLKALGATIALDPQEDYIKGNRERIFSMLAGVDIFLPSQVEIERLLGHQDFERAARQLAEYGCKTIIIKLGSSGSLIFDRVQDQFWNIPAFPAAVCDTTGAGDAYCGGFMGTYIRSHDLALAGEAGAVSASFAIEDFGLAHMFKADTQEAQKRLEYMHRLRR